MKSQNSFMQNIPTASWKSLFWKQKKTKKVSQSYFVRQKSNAIFIHRRVLISELSILKSYPWELYK